MAPKLIEDLVPKLLSLATVQKVLQNLLDEGVHIRDMRTILETLAEHAPQTQDASVLTALVRVALGAAIVQQFYPSAQELQVIGMDKELEYVLAQALQAGGSAIEPGLANTLLREARSCGADAGTDGSAHGAAGAGPYSRSAGALPETFAAATQSNFARRSAGVQNDPVHIHGRR